VLEIQSATFYAKAKDSLSSSRIRIVPDVTPPSPLMKNSLFVDLLDNRNLEICMLCSTGTVSTSSFWPYVARQVSYRDQRAKHTKLGV
jgi:hypothetical protein